MGIEVPDGVVQSLDNLLWIMIVSRIQDYQKAFLPKQEEETTLTETEKTENEI